MRNDPRRLRCKGQDLSPKTFNVHRCHRATFCCENAKLPSNRWQLLDGASSVLYITIIPPKIRINHGSRRDTIILVNELRCRWCRRDSRPSHQLVKAFKSDALFHASQASLCPLQKRFMFYAGLLLLLGCFRSLLLLLMILSPLLVQRVRFEVSMTPSVISEIKKVK